MHGTAGPRADRAQPPFRRTAARPSDDKLITRSVTEPDHFAVRFDRHAAACGHLACSTHARTLGRGDHGGMYAIYGLR